MITHVPQKSGPFPLTMTSWHKQLGNPMATLDSVHGPDAQVQVYANAGIAMHVVGDYVQVIELFKPTKVAGYENSFYRRPVNYLR